jgi:glycosyltransferase involved in cell wall biosynthesis
VNFAGEVPAEKIPDLDRSAHVLYAADVNAACPNSVIEALACGLPVVAFDTGALSELITVDAGRLSPYGGDPWNLDPPDIESLAEAANQIITNQVGFRTAARKRAEEAFALNQMVQGYLDVINL